MTNEAFINYVESHYDYDDLVELNEEELERWHQTAEEDFQSNNKSTVALDIIYDNKKEIVQTANELYYSNTRNNISRARTIEELPTIDNKYSSDTVNMLNTAYNNRSDFIKETLAGRREEGLNLDYGDVQSSVFARSIRSGNVTKSFRDFYNLNDEEAEFVVNRLNQEYIEEQLQEESE